MSKISLSNHAYDLLKQAIITCQLVPGEMIAQKQLADIYGIGLSPVREALQRLAQEGFVQPMPRYGYRICPITLSDVQELFELRLILETAAVRLTAERATDQELYTLLQEAKFTYIYHDHETYITFLSRNDQFHRSIALLSGNQRLVEALSRVLGELLRVFHLGLELRDSAEEMQAEHLELVDALRQRDANMAEQLVYRQITRSQDRVIQALTQSMKTVKTLSLTQQIQLK